MLLQGLEMFYVAFMDLSTDRHIGFAEGPIPWSSVDRYCQAYGFVGETREDLEFFIRDMDTAYLEHRAKNASKKTPPKPAPSSSPAKGNRNARTMLRKA